MRLRVLLLCAVIFPTLATAEIYKWKDSNGVVRYSDVPPPSNIKQESMYGKKIPKPTGLPPLAAVEGDATAAANRDKAAVKAKATGEKSISDKSKEDKAPLSKEEAAKKRSNDAEVQKKLDEQKKADLESRQASCKSAKQNLATYSSGGRISRADENGNKQYLGDADISQGKLAAQQDIDKYCD